MRQAAPVVPTALRPQAAPVSGMRGPERGGAGRGGGSGFRRHAAPRGGAMATAGPGMESAGGRGTAGAG